MNLNEIRFKAVEAPHSDCTGCIFSKLPFSNCVLVERIAEAEGQPDCEDKSASGKTYIYVPDDSDPRQIPLIDGKGEVVTKGGHE